MEQKAKFTAREWYVIFILAITQFTVIVDFMIMSPMGDMLMKSLSLTTNQFGYSVSAYAFSAGVSGMLAAGFADKFDRKKLLLFFYVGFILGTFFCGFATSFATLLAARIITGLFGGVIGAIAMAIVTDLFTMQLRGKVMGFVQMGFGVSQVMGVPISLYIANHWGWQMPFVAVAVLAVFIAVLILFKLPAITGHLALQQNKNALQHLISTFAKREYRIGFLVTAFLNFGGYLMMPFGSVYAVNNLHVTYDQLPLLFMLTGIVTLILMPIVGSFSDKVDKFKLFAIACIWMTIFIVIYTNLPVVPFWAVLMFQALMMTGIIARMIPYSALITAVPSMADRGAFMSVNSSLQQMVGGVGAAFAGMIVVQESKTSPLQHYDTLGYIVLITGAISIWMMYRVDKIAKARAAEIPPAVHDADAQEVLAQEIM
jgi:Arabinose efflux permease